MFQKVQVIGYLGRDPEARFLPNGDAVTNFSVAASERWKDKSGEQQEHTEWFNVTTFGRLAEICGEYLTKGSLVLIEGTQRTERYTDKDGVERFSVKLRGKEMKMLGGRPDADREPADRGRPTAPSERAPRAAPRPAPAPRPTGRPATGFDDMDDDIPF